MKITDEQLHVKIASIQSKQKYTGISIPDRSKPYERQIPKPDVSFTFKILKGKNNEI